MSFTWPINNFLSIDIAKSWNLGKKQGPEIRSYILPKIYEGNEYMPKKLFIHCHEKEIENMWPTDLISSFPMLLCLFDGNNYKTVK